MRLARPRPGPIQGTWHTDGGEERHQPHIEPNKMLWLSPLHHLMVERVRLHTHTHSRVQTNKHSGQHRHHHYHHSSALSTKLFYCPHIKYVLWPPLCTSSTACARSKQRPQRQQCVQTMTGGYNTWCLLLLVPRLSQPAE